MIVKRLYGDSLLRYRDNGEVWVEEVDSDPTPEQLLGRKQQLEEFIYKLKDDQDAVVYVLNVLAGNNYIKTLPITKKKYENARDRLREFMKRQDIYSC